MRLAFMVLQVACSGATEAPGFKSAGLDTGEDATLSDDTAEGADTAPPVDSADTASEGSSWACPEGMVPVSAAGEDEPVFCIDAYENQVEGALGDRNQHLGVGVPTTAIALNAAGVVPDTLLSYGQAHAACANTPVLDSDGVEVGRKRLPTSAEWEDAGDGVLGAGGTIYPYGDTWSDTACATPLGDGEVVLSELQPTGSYPDCVSSFGVYDLIGNAWEWTDSGIVLDIEAWFAVAEAVGVDVSLGPGDTILAGPLATESLELRVQGLSARVPDVGADGGLMVGPESFDEHATDLAFTGFLVIREDFGDLAFLPVWFDVPIRETLEDPPVTTSDERILVLWEAEGATVPDKRGCAYYIGSAFGCTLDSASTVHMYDFVGTVSFRCVAGPLFSAP